MKASAVNSISITRHLPFRLVGTVVRLGVLTTVALVVMLAQPAFGQFTFSDINPDNSTLDPSDPDGASGGRVNGLASVVGNNDVYYAASEWGGIYKTIDAGLTWFRLDAHNPNATWDVEVDPGNTSSVVATSFYDGRVNSLAGINISYDSGTTWNLVSVPNTNNICSGSRFAEPSAFGIAFDPDDSDNIYVGTNCGLAVSTDGGSSWARVEVDETPNNSDTDVWDVVVHDGGIIDACGDNGHHRSTDGGGTWDASAGLPGGVCSIAVSPDEQDVLFVSVGTNVWESDNGGDTWTNLGTPDFARQGRIPFVETNQRSDDGDDDVFDLYFGDIGMYRASCVSGGPGNRCPVAYAAGNPPDTPPTGWSGSFTRSGAGSGGAHDDVAAIVFDSEAGIDACPTIFSSDGGVYYNTLNASPGCHNPVFEQPTVTPHGLWLWTLTGVDTAGQDLEDLYFANQDNGPFGASDGGAASPTWVNPECCDGFDTAADASQVLFTVCCYSPGRATLMFNSPPGGGMSTATQINPYPPGGLFPGFRFPDIVDQWGAAGQYVVLTRDCTAGTNGCPASDGGVYITTNATNPITWTELGPTTEPNTGAGGICAVKASMNGATPTFYAQVGNCDGLSSDQLWRFEGTTPTDGWEQVNLPVGNINIFDVDPNDPDRLFAANNTNPPQMVLSEDGGTSWDNLPELDTLMQGGGAYKYVNSRGPRGPVDLQGYPQPSLVAFDAEDPNILVAGGRDSGVFLSTDRGEDWVLVTNPNSTGGGVPHLPQPWFAYFDHESVSGTGVNMYIGTRGRGVWRVSFEQPPVADAGGPYTTDEGVDRVLDGSGSFDPNGSSLTFAWDLDNDGFFDDSSDEMPNFDMVGQDGVFTVRLRVTNGDGLSDIDESTVTVNNVAPTVLFVPQDPEDEGAPLIVTGTISDPGWLENLTGTINWGDGSPTENVGGVLENNRPDATLTFDVNHCYGDNGLYPVEVCGFDDDTSTCETINVTIDNVAPVVAIDAGQVTEIDEGQVINVLANFADQGWLDTYVSTIDWGYTLWPPEPGNLNITIQGSDCNDPDVGTVTGSRQYGDNDDGGGFTINVSVGDDDGGVGMSAFNLTVNNIDPTAEIDEINAVDVCGVPFFIAHAGEDVDFSGRSIDPGSDDLFLSWDWDDGPPSPDVTTDYLVGVPVPGDPDPLPSPEVSPRDVTDEKTHVFADACYYNVMFLADDDDSGHGEDDTNVVIFGNARRVRSAGYWYNQFRKMQFFTEDQLNCYLDIVNHMSSVFSEETDADSIADARDMMHPGQSKGEIRVQFDRQLMAVWLNLANGAIEFDDLVDTDFDSVPDTELLTFLCAAEAARLNPASTKSELEDIKDLLEAINVSGN